MVFSRDEFVGAFHKSKPSKPKKKLFFSGDKRSSKKEIQEAIEGSKTLELKQLLDDLMKEDSKFAGELVAYKLKKHADNPKKWSMYLLAIPKDLWTPEMWKTFGDGDFDWVTDDTYKNEVVRALKEMPDDVQQDVIDDKVAWDKWMLSLPVDKWSAEHKKQFRETDFSWVQSADWAEMVWESMKLLPKSEQIEMLTKNSGRLLHVFDAIPAPQLIPYLNGLDGLDDALGISAEDKRAFQDELDKSPFDIDLAQQKLKAMSGKQSDRAKLLVTEKLSQLMLSPDKKDWTKLFVASEEFWGAYGFMQASLGANGNFDWVDKDNAAKLKELLLKQGGSGRVALLGNRTLMSAIQRADPAIYQDLVRDIPQLRAVRGVADSLVTDGVDPNSDEYLERGAEGIFASVLGEGDHALTGFEYLADANRTGRLNVMDWLSGAVDGTTGGPCSVLTNLLTRLAQTWPGPGELRVNVHEIIDPVMTKPLAAIDPTGRGMVTRGFAGKSGNVFIKGKPTGQVFFSGGGSGAAHTWISINGVAFDSLFGTMGDEVAGAVDEEFSPHPSKPDRWIGKNSGRVLIKDKKLKNSGSNMGFSSYRLE